MKSRGFNFKTFTSFTLAMTFLLLVVSGATLYISPPGRVAHWTDWRLLGITKEGWGGIHILMALVFLIGGLFHILRFNWKIFLHYIRTRSGDFHYGRELVGAALLTALVLTGTMVGVPPFSSVLTLNENIKESWEPASANAPVPHMEQQTVSEVAQFLGIGPGEATGRLNARGIPADSTETLRTIADREDKSPRSIYQILAEGEKRQAQSALPSGVGRKSIAQVAPLLESDAELMLQWLKTKGVKASPDTRIRDLAAELQIPPHQVLTDFQQFLQSRSEGAGEGGTAP